MKILASNEYQAPSESTGNVLVLANDVNALEANLDGITQVVSLDSITGPGFDEDGVVDAIEKVTDVRFFTCSLIGNPNSPCRTSTSSSGMSQMSNFSGRLITGTTPPITAGNWVRPALFSSSAVTTSPCRRLRA